MAGLSRLRAQLGGPGMAALAVLAAAGLFFMLFVQPLQERSRLLDAALERDSGPPTASEKLAAFYRFLERKEETTDWLAKLHAIGKATGVELSSASYRTEKAGGRLERYEIAVPVRGTYPQIREFLKRALADIPVLSLDQVRLRRESRTQGSVQAELRLSLHRMKP